MISEPQTTRTPEERAEDAALALADQGKAVTARAVREAAGVRMTVAAAAASSWRQAQEESTQVEVPPMPEDVRKRMDAAWAEAYRTAVEAVSPERDRLADEVTRLDKEVGLLTGNVVDLETQLDNLGEDLDAARQHSADVEQRAIKAETEAREAALRAQTAEDERERTAKQLEALIAKLPEAATGQG